MVPVTLEANVIVLFGSAFASVIAPRRLQSLSAVVQALSDASSVVVSTWRVDAADATLPETSVAATAKPLLAAMVWRSCFSRARRRRLLN